VFDDRFDQSAQRAAVDDQLAADAEQAALTDGGDVQEPTDGRGTIRVLLHALHQS
jgi:hypothetical protein